VAAASAAEAESKPDWTVQQRAENLLRVPWRWEPGVTVTFSFEDRPDLDGSELTPSQKISARLALELWGDVSGLRFGEVETGGLLAFTNDTSLVYAGGGDAVPEGGLIKHGIVWLNSSYGWSMEAPIVGQYSFLVVVHEIGHAIGLPHPGDYAQGDGSPLTYAATAAYRQDTMQYSIMSYFYDAPSRGSDFKGSVVQTPMLDDVAALQLAYGAPTSTRLGDTTYGFNFNADRVVFNFVANPMPVLCIVDSGGIDTLDLSGYSDTQLISLAPGSFSNVGGLTGNVSIAFGTVIENGIGGWGADTITGNDSANVLSGGPGDDRLYGGDGHDTLAGGEGAGFLRGEGGNDSLAGGALFDDLHGNMGDDTLHGWGDGDWVVGGKDQDLLYGDDGGDVVLGNIGYDTCFGGDGADVIRGGQGDDLVFGEGGDDWLSGDRGNDTVSGGAGADTFHTFEGAGLDRVTDFNAAEGDRVYLLSGTQYSVLQVGGDTVVDLGNGDQLILAGVTAASLPQGWIFGA